MNRTFIVAEMGASHCQDKNKAIDLIRAASAAGADAIKFQTFKPENMVADMDYILAEGLWTGKNLHDLYEKAMLPWEWHEELFEYARSLDIVPFSSPFCKESVDLLETLNCPMYKVASFEIVDLDLIRYIASTGKNMIISTGMATANEIEDATIAAKGCKDLLLLKCTSAYPASESDINLATMADMKGKWGFEVGLSDHTRGNSAAIGAVAMGATVIEKHIRLHQDGGLDDGFALNPTEFATFVSAIRDMEDIIGTVQYGVKNSEKSSKNLSRSLYFSKDLKAGVVLTSEDFKTARPNMGMSPRFKSDLIGKTLITDVSENQPVKWEINIENNI